MLEIHIDPRIFTNVSKINVIKTIQTPNCLKMIPKQSNPKYEIATNVDATTFYEQELTQVPKIVFQEPYHLRDTLELPVEHLSDTQQHLAKRTQQRTLTANTQSRPSSIN